MLTTNLPVYFTSSSLCYPVAMILITNIYLWIAIGSRLRDVFVCDKLFQNDMHHPSSALAISSSPITSFHATRWLSMLTIVRLSMDKNTRYSKLTFPISVLREWRSHVFSRRLSGSLHLLLSSPPQYIIIFSSQILDYACSTSFIDTPKINLLHLFWGLAVLHNNFTHHFESSTRTSTSNCIFLTTKLSNYLENALLCLLRTSSLQHAHQSV